MRSLKKLLAVLVALTLMVSVFAVPAFAAESFDYEDEAKALYDLGLFKGTSTTEYKPALDARLERQEGAVLVLRLFGLEEEANKLSEADAKAILAGKFSDADEVGAWAVKAIAYAVQNGIIDGRPDGKFAPKDPLLGKEFAKMILAKLGQDYDFQTACADLASVSGMTAAEAIKFNDKILIRDDVVGISFGSLEATYKDSGKTVLAVLAEGNATLKAKALELGLIKIVKINTVVEAINIKVGEAVQLPAKAEVEYSDGSVAEVALTWDSSAVKTDVAGEYKAIGSVAGFDGTIEAAITVTPDVLAVESVTANNLKEIVVVFNQDISENAEAAKKDNYTLDISGTKVDAVKVDGDTAVLTLDKGADNQKKVKLTVAAKILPAKEVFELTFFDGTLPEVVGYEVTGPKSIRIEFSEPMDNAVKGKVTLKSGNSTLSVNTNPKFSGAIVDVPLYSTLTDGKTYTLTIADFEDYAGYKNVIKTIEFVYEKDETPPVAVVDEATQEYVKVTFNKPVKGLTPEHFSHTFTAYTALQLSKKAEYPLDKDGIENANFIKDTDSVSTVYVYFYGRKSTPDGKNGIGKDAGKIDRPISEGESTFRIRSKAGSIEIKDEWGNKFADEAYTITVAADKVAPEVKAVKVESKNSISVEFTKSVTFTKDNIEVLSESGEKIDGVKVSVTTPSPEKKFVVGLAKDLTGKTVLINIKNVEDTTLNANKLVSYSTTIDITDTEDPIVNKVAHEKDGTDGKGFLYVFYNESVDSETALKVSNYFLYDAKAAADKKYTKLDGATSFFAGDKIVRISLSKAQYTTVKAIAEDLEKGGLFVTGVKDIALNEIIPVTVEIKGNLATANSLDIADIDADNPAKGKKVYATAPDKIEITFNQELEVKDDAFTVEAGGKNYNVSDVAVDYVSGVTKAILSVERIDGDKVIKLPYDATNVKITIAAKALKNAFETENDTAIEYTLKQVNDKIAPALSKNPEQGASSNFIKLTFEEKVKFTVNSDLAADFIITNKSDDDKVLKAGIDFTIEEGENTETNVITIKLLKDYVDSTLKIVTNESREYIKDLNGNKLEKIDKDVVIDDIDAPVYKSVSIDDTKKIVTIVFDEDIENAGTAAALKAAVTVDDAALGADDTVEITDGKLVITFKTALAADTNIKVAASALQDAAGNKNAAVEVTVGVVAP